MISAEWEKILCEGILFISYILICGGLTRSRFSKTVTMLAAGGTIAVVVLIQAALLVSGQDLTLVLTLLPLTAYLPVIICVHFLSRSGFFQTMAVWTVGVIVYFVLKMFRKLFVQNLAVRTGLSGWNGNLLTTVCLLLAAGLMIFLVFRFLRRPFQTYVAENHTNWLLLSFPVLMVFLLFSYVGNSTTDDTLLILLFLTACSIFLVLVRVLTSATAIARLEGIRKGSFPSGANAAPGIREYL